MKVTKVKSNAEGPFEDGSELTGEPPLREFTAIRIPVPWGHMAGKWYGPLDKRPVLGLHGWMDNAGTYDFLAALLPKNMAFLTLDWPGHGLSSPIPNGCYYHVIDNVYLLRLIMDHFKWKKLSFMAHSMSVVVAFIFSAFFPDLVELVICFDGLKPLYHNPSVFVRQMINNMEGFLKELQRSGQNSDPPQYTLDEIIDVLYEGSYQSVDKARCIHLLARNIKKSDVHADRYVFCRDRRYKFYNNNFGVQQSSEAMAKRITGPYMVIKSTTSSYFEDKIHFDQVLEEMMKNPNFKYMECDGTHHFHFNNPESIIEPVIEFLRCHAKDSFEMDGSSSQTLLSKL